MRTMLQQALVVAGVLALPVGSQAATALDLQCAPGAYGYTWNAVYAVDGTYTVLINQCAPGTGALDPVPDVPTDPAPYWAEGWIWVRPAGAAAWQNICEWNGSVAFTVSRCRPAPGDSRDVELTVDVRP